MRLTILTLIAALGLAASTLSANAAPAVPERADHANIVQVWGGCGPGAYPVPGHWSPYRGWVPPHCRASWRAYGGYYGSGYRPYWGWHRNYW